VVVPSPGQRPLLGVAQKPAQLIPAPSPKYDLA